MRRIYYKLRLEIGQRIIYLYFKNMKLNQHFSLCSQDYLFLRVRAWPRERYDECVRGASGQRRVWISNRKSFSTCLWSFGLFHLVCRCVGVTETPWHHITTKQRLQQLYEKTPQKTAHRRRLIKTLCQLLFSVLLYPELIPVFILKLEIIPPREEDKSIKHNPPMMTFDPWRHRQR